MKNQPYSKLLSFSINGCLNNLNAYIVSENLHIEKVKINHTIFFKSN
jgi:hypothetical protein